MQRYLLFTLIATLAATLVISGCNVDIDEVSEPLRIKGAMKNLFHNDPNVRMDAIFYLYEHKDDAIDAGPKMLEVMKSDEDKDTRILAMKAVRFFLEPTELEEEWVEIIRNDEDLEIRIQALHLISYERDDFNDYKPVFDEIFKEGNPELKVAAINKLHWFDPGDEDIIRIIMEVIEDIHPEVKLTGINYIRLSVQSKKMMGDDLSINPYMQALPRLRAFLDDEDQDIRFSAAVALSYIEPDNGNILPILIDGLQRASSRGNALRTLYRTDINGKEAIPYVIEILQHKPEGPSLIELIEQADEDEDILELLRKEKPGCYFLEILDEMKAEKVEIQKYNFFKETSSLIVYPESKTRFKVESGPFADSVIYETAVETLGGLGPSPESIEILISILEDDDTYIRARAVGSLAKIGSEATDTIVPLLIKMLADPEPAVRGSIYRGFVEMGAVAESALPAINTALEMEVEKYHHINISYAVNALITIWFETGQLENVESLIEHESSTVRDAAIQHLGKIGPEAVPFLIGMTIEDNESRIEMAFRSVRQIAEQYPELLGTYIDMLSDESPQIRLDAVSTLGVLGPIASDALPALREIAANDEFEPIRDMAELSIKLIEEGTLENHIYTPAN